MKTLVFCASLLLSVTAPTSYATEYVYRDLMANTLPAPRCDSADKAANQAAGNANVERYAKKFCQTQGYGWHVEQVKDAGKTVCDSCEDSQGLQKCHQQDMIVMCKRIKPSTVGMLPGEG